MNQYIIGSAHRLTAVSDKSVQSIITSIPYYKKRKYSGDQLTDWPAVTFPNPFTAEPITVPPTTAELGNEDTAVQFIGHIMLCLREMWRVLRDDGVLVLNIGDTYARGGHSVHANFKPKDAMMIPERIALCAQADGWYVRNSIPWLKRSHMPEGPTDRLSVSHETIYIMTKSPRYYFDVASIRQPGVSYYRPGGTSTYTADSGLVQGVGSRSLHQLSNDTGRHCRTMDIFDMSLVALAEALASDAATLREYMQGEQGGVVVGGDLTAVIINPQPYPKAHYATFPLPLAKLFVKATTPDVACALCGAPFYPKYRKEFVAAQDTAERGTYRYHADGSRQMCNCNGGECSATVLDPFAGSGTTGEACVDLGRDFILNDISAEYISDHCIPRTAKTRRLI